MVLGSITAQGLEYARGGALPSGGAAGPAEPLRNGSVAAGTEPGVGAQAQGEAAGAGGPAMLPEGGGAQDALARSKAEARVKQGELAEACRTCKNRMYQDGSNDPGVSFKSPARVDPSMAASVIMGHEQEHVAHEQAKAKQNGGEVVSQSVTLHSDICPECGRTYIAGGTTRTQVAYGSGERQDAGQPGARLDRNA